MMILIRLWLIDVKYCHPFALLSLFLTFLHLYICVLLNLVVC